MERILIYIKHHLSFLWSIFEWVNGAFFSLVYQNKMAKVLIQVFNEFSVSPFIYRELKGSDITVLHGLLNSQESDDLEYFNPHGFGFKSLRNQFRNRAFLMMGTFDNEKLIGYFFLRFFINRKCFVGRLIDKSYRGRGIGSAMNNIMYETSWRMGFRCLSTISRNNEAVMRAHAKNQKMIVLKDLQNDFLLVEFRR